MGVGGSGLLSCCRGLCCCGVSSVQGKFVSNASGSQLCKVATYTLRPFAGWGCGTEHRARASCARNLSAAELAHVANR